MRLHELTQRVMQRCARQVSQEQPHRCWSWLAMLVVVALFATTAGGQTLFARADTTPDYASYRNWDECVVTILRIADAMEREGQTTWWDTVGAAAMWTNGDKMKTRDNGENLRNRARPDAAIKAGQRCLARFNADTATFTHYTTGHKILNALLMAHRDDDANRFAERFLDSMRAQSATAYKDRMEQVLFQYATARPVRFTEAKRYYEKMLANVAGDSLYRTVTAHYLLGLAAAGMHDTTYADELAWRAIQTNDSIPDKRHRFWGEYGNDRLLWMMEYLERRTEDEGLDSLEVSTLAYKMWKQNIVIARIYGGEQVTAMDALVQPYKVPDLVGDQYYRSTIGGSSSQSGQARESYVKLGAVPPGTLPVKGRLNFITSWPSFCHTEGDMRDPEAERRLPHSLSWCADHGYNKMRRYKELYPDLEIIVLSDTYGTVGQLGPLTPADEADTLAKLFLGYHRVPAHLVVEHTPFFHVDAPDGRRIDLPTPQMELLGRTRTLYDYNGGITWLTDKEGYVVAQLVGGKGGARSEYWARFMSILKNRPSK